ncbi:hypothetical protein BH20ACT2_BH20ACT2_20080 [soil metagenome]
MLARVVGGVGRALIAAGALILLFVAYQLWGTGIRESQAQDDLRAQLRERIEETSPSTTTSTTTVAGEIGPSGEPRLPAETVSALGAPPPDGEPIGSIRIPEIDVDKVFVEGVTLPNLKKGPGHFPGTPLPGQAGNAAIAGHRTTYGAPFHNLDQLAVGDEIEVTTVQGDFIYEVVEEPFVVEPSQVEVLDDVGDNRLTLTACHPKYSAAKRIIVQAVLVGDPVPAPPPARAAEPVVFDDLDGEDASRWPAILWALAVAVLALVIWLLARTQRGRRLRRTLIFAASTPVFLVALFFFFEAFARLLPSAY